MRHFQWLSLILLVASAPGFAEGPVLPQSAVLGDEKSSMFPVFSDIKLPTSFIGVLEVPAYSFYLGAPDIHGVSYQPNFSLRFGAKLAWKEWGTMLTFPLPMPEVEKQRRGDTVQTNIVLNKYWRQNAIDIYYQDFRGFYVSSPGTELSISKPGRYPQLPDAHVKNFGFNWYFALHQESYSLRAAFSQTEVQLTSGGSWIMTAFYNHLSMDLGAIFLPGSDGVALNPPSLNSSHFDTIGAGFGYGYTYVQGRYFANGQIALTPAVQYQFIDQRSSATERFWSLATKGNVNASIGFNYDDYVGGIKALGDTIYSHVEGNQLWSTLLAGQAFFGRRF